MNDITYIKDEIANLASIVELRQSKGWKELTKHFTEVLEQIKINLTEEIKPENIIRLQCQYKAYNAMLETVDVLVEKYYQDLQQIQDMQNEQQYRDKYAI